MTTDDSRPERRNSRDKFVLAQEALVEEITSSIKEEILESTSELLDKELSRIRVCKYCGRIFLNTASRGKPQNFCCRSCTVMAQNGSAPIYTPERNHT